MEKVSGALLHSQQKLNKSEKLDLFAAILSDVQSTKMSLVNHLPFIISKAYAKDVKLLLLESGTIINGQLIRVCLIKTQLGLSFIARPPLLNGCLNLEQYLKSGISGKSSKSDAIILSHLIVAEGIEIDAFRILIKLAKSIKPKSFINLLLVCRREAYRSKKALKTMLEQTINN